jgi:hypothetical protein
VFKLTLLLRLSTIEIPIDVILLVLTTGKYNNFCGYISKFDPGNEFGVNVYNIFELLLF